MYICAKCRKVCEWTAITGSLSNCCNFPVDFVEDTERGNVHEGSGVVGRKDDSGKTRMDLLPFESLEAVAKVLTFGAKKYADNNWQKVDNAESRYIGALLRHLSAYMQGEMFDVESGLSHISHVATNALFLVYFEEKKK
jgi:hypothetical protein